MLYIFTALYCEAHIFIRHYHLMKNSENTLFQEFYNEKAGIRLTITGVGEINAATAVSGVCSVYKPQRGDLLLNVGTCAHNTKSNGIFLCNKIIEQITGKTFYPDMLYRHNFCEEAIVTGMLPWISENDSTGPSAANLNGKLYDMEAAAIYQAGSYFFCPHQMMFLKIVSDGGSAKEISKEQVEHLMEQEQDRIFEYITQIQMIAYRNSQQGFHLQKEEDALIEMLCRDLHCSKVMRDFMKQCIHYLILVGADYDSVIQDMYKEGLLPCKDKREGKLRFEEFKRRLF